MDEILPTDSPLFISLIQVDEQDGRITMRLHPTASLFAANAEDTVDENSLRCVTFRRLADINTYAGGLDQHIVNLLRLLFEREVISSAIITSAVIAVIHLPEIELRLYNNFGTLMRALDPSAQTADTFEEEVTRHMRPDEPYGQERQAATRSVLKQIVAAFNKHL